VYVMIMCKTLHVITILHLHTFILYVIIRIYNYMCVCLCIVHNYVFVWLFAYLSTKECVAPKTTSTHTLFCTWTTQEHHQIYGNVTKKGKS